MSSPHPTPDGETLAVYYDGSCPLCRREIGFYRNRRGGERIDWIDVSRCASATVADDLSKEAALARFHVRRADGRLVSGGRAFAELWSALPVFRLAGLTFRIRPLYWLLDRAYDLFLPMRPALQRLLSKPREPFRQS